MRIAIEASIPYLRGVAEQFADVVYLSSEEIVSGGLRGLKAQALLVRSITPCHAETLEGTGIGFIATATAGFDHIDLDYCAQEGIGWTNAGGCNAEAVAQWVMACLSLSAIQSEECLRGKTIGIVGVGHVGRAVERMALALGMRTLVYDPPRCEQDVEFAKYATSLERLQRETDIITLHVPLTNSGLYPTQDLVDVSFLASCRPSFTLINACRGGVVDAQALIDAKHGGHIGRLFVDCWPNEPHISTDLMKCVDIATPHIAGFSADGKHRGARMALASILVYGGQSVPKWLYEPRELEEPRYSVIELEDTPRGLCLEYAIVHTYSPLATDALLRQSPESFEMLRRSYTYPRELSAYTIKGGSVDERRALQKLGFRLG